MVEVETDAGPVFDIFADEVDAVRERLGKVIDEKMVDVVEKLRELLRDLTPKRTGFTAESWTVLHVGEGEFFITNSNEPVITFLLEGTNPHDIPREPMPPGRWLHWFDDFGGEHFAKQVHHPGTEAQPIIEEALAEIDDDIAEALATAVDEVWDQEVT